MKANDDKIIIFSGKQRRAPEEVGPMLPRVQNEVLEFIEDKHNFNGVRTMKFTIILLASFNNKTVKEKFFYDKCFLSTCF